VISFLVSIMPDTPDISVILPFFNSEDHAVNSLHSIQQQTLPNLEIIALDNGSDDGTRRLLLEIAAKDPRILVIGLDRSVSFGDAKNSAIRLASADLIAFQCQGDISDPARLQIQAAYLKDHPEIHAIGSAIQFIYSNSPGSKSTFRSACDESDMSLGLGVSQEFFMSSITLRKQCALPFGMGFQTINDCSDWEFFSRFVRYGYRLRNLPQALVSRPALSPSKDVLRPLTGDSANQLRREHLIGSGIPAHAIDLLAHLYCSGLAEGKYDEFSEINRKRIDQWLTTLQRYLKRHFANEAIHRFCDKLRKTGYERAGIVMNEEICNA
jgi:glycosyltransferase involved in cell wall biosynthesis